MEPKNSGNHNLKISREPDFGLCDSLDLKKLLNETVFVHLFCHWYKCLTGIAKLNEAGQAQSDDIIG